MNHLLLSVIILFVLILIMTKTKKNNKNIYQIEEKFKKNIKKLN